MDAYLGIDVGSVTTKLVLIGEDNEILAQVYSRTQGKPIQMVQQGLAELAPKLANGVEIRGVGATGSGRQLTATVVGADVVKNEITAHAVAASYFVPGVQTVLEIGGQDSKIIILRDGVVVDFGMNTVCAAGTGSFLDQQAMRLGIPIEEFGPLALKSQSPVRIAGRCTVFAESDMIHKQQMGHRLEDILYGLCEALVRNYLNNIGLGKDIQPPVVFQGGVAANAGIVRAFEEALKTPIVVPSNFYAMGAFGAAMLAREHIERTGQPSKFRGTEVSQMQFQTTSFECKACANICEIIQIKRGREVLARWGGRCDRWAV